MTTSKQPSKAGKYESRIKALENFMARWPTEEGEPSEQLAPHILLFEKDKRIAALEARLAMLESVLKGKSAERVAPSEDGVLTEPLGDLESRFEKLESSVRAQEEDLKEADKSFHSHEELIKDMQDVINGVHEKIEQIETHVTGLARTTRSVGAQSLDGVKFKIPEPKPYDGARVGKDVENFLFDMEQYFRLSHVTTDEHRVDVAALYLSGDAKVWWRIHPKNITAIHNPV